MFDLSLAISHHLLIFALFGVLAAELVLVRPGLDQATIARTARIDLWYGIVAGLIVIVGFTRAIFAAKGWFYYEHNVYFWSKMGAFAAIALLSVPPTIRYIRWQRAGTTPSDLEIAVVRRFLWLEVVLFALLPIFAAAMARGYGEFAGQGPDIPQRRRARVARGPKPRDEPTIDANDHGAIARRHIRIAHPISTRLPT